MRAPQYPKGLRLEAFGSGMVGDVRELNIINHYVGMPPIDPAPALETAVFPIGSPSSSPCACFRRCTGGRAGLRSRPSSPCRSVILIDLQWWLYRFGHSLDPKAPIRLEPFTPLVIGSSTLGNFVTSSTISWGVVCLLAAAARARAGRTTEPAPRIRFACTRRRAQDSGGLDRQFVRHRPRRGPAGYRVGSDARAAGPARRRAAR